MGIQEQLLKRKRINKENCKMPKSKVNIKKAIELMGKKPMNPIGECFDSSLHCLLNPELNQEIIKLKDVKLCHGIGIANIPGQEGREMAHAWIEYTRENGKRAALDTTWGVATGADHYHKGIESNYVVEYTPEEALENWKKGVAPWDKKIKQISKR